MTVCENLTVVESFTGNAVMVANFVDESYYVELSPQATPSDLEEMETVLAEYGLEMMDETECPAELQADDTVRIWCASTLLDAA